MGGDQTPPRDSEEDLQPIKIWAPPQEPWEDVCADFCDDTYEPLDPATLQNDTTPIPNQKGASVTRKECFEKHWKCKAFGCRSKDVAFQTGRRVERGAFLCAPTPCWCVPDRDSRYFSAVACGTIMLRSRSRL